MMEREKDDQHGYIVATISILPPSTEVHVCPAAERPPHSLLHDAHSRVLACLQCPHRRGSLSDAFNVLCALTEIENDTFTAHSVNIIAWAVKDPVLLTGHHPHCTPSILSSTNSSSTG
ncbi:hypothetical protein TcWFU_004724 [Taenia crassiceps]|uniref:Uncharacterized protein n=1 Tax=Taenia crassiceps TaxID=6207 RepID=A0ABR4Q881_9CEST